MNTNINKTNNDFTTNLKKIVNKRWDEEKKKAAVPYEEKYKRMVEEAVLIIKNEWETSAKYLIDPKQPTETVNIEAHNAFYVTEKDLKLYSSVGYRTRNPKTGCCCFYTEFQFKSKQDVKQYLEDVLALLPEGTEYKEMVVTEVVFGENTKYSFSITLNMQ